jgi:hypothetical protein
MKIHQLTKLLTASSFLGASTLSATVTSVGVDSTAGPNWRTGAQLETDLEYGTSGYVIFGLNELDAVYNPNYDISSANAGNAYSLPAGISISTADTNIGMWSGNAANFGEIQDPGNGNAITNSPVLANSTGTRQFTISRATSSNYRITVLTASGDNQGTEFTLIVNDGSGAVISSYDHQVNGLAYHVFDVSTGMSDIVIDIASDAENRSLMGIAFDSETIDLTDPSDLNSNSIGDSWEEFYFGGVGVVDPGADEEPDGLTNLEEWQNLTNPVVADSDADGLEDGEEVTTHSTSPTDNDTDDDGYDDKFEVDNLASNFDPLVDDSSEDPDDDGLDNAAELANSTNAIDPDSDDDTIKDGDEVGGKVNPFNGDIFGVAPGDPTDPLNPDSDGDTIDDFAEIDNANGFITNPNSVDTDGDTVSDNTELDNGSDPTDSASVPPIPAGLISVDLQGNPEGAAFDPDPVLMSGFEARAGFMTGVWNALTLPGHPNVALNPSFDLVDANGDDSGVTFSLSGTVSSWTNLAGNDPLTNEYLFVNAGNADFNAAWEISGVGGGSNFTLFAYGGIVRDMLFTVDTNGDGDLNDETPTNVGAAGFEFTGTAGSDGKIIGSIDPGESNEANWGGFQLLQVGSGLGGLRITDISYTADDAIELTWTSRPGRSYAVEVSTDLENWVDLLTEIDAAVSPATATKVIVDRPAANETKKHYRVREE